MNKFITNQKIKLHSKQKSFKQTFESVLTYGCVLLMFSISTGTLIAKGKEINERNEKYIEVQNDIDLSPIITNINNRLFEYIDIFINAKTINENIAEPIKETEETSASIAIPLEKIIVSTSLIDNNAYNCNSYAFSYMAYQRVTCPSSYQYQLLYSDRAYTDTLTGLRMVDGRICIALGLGHGYYVGDYVDVVLSNGEILECIMGDVKASKECDSTSKYHLIGDGSVVELIVDDDYFVDTNQFPECIQINKDLNDSPNGRPYVLELRKIEQ